MHLDDFKNTNIIHACSTKISNLAAMREVFPLSWNNEILWQFLYNLFHWKQAFQHFLKAFKTAFFTNNNFSRKLKNVKYDVVLHPKVVKIFCKLGSLLPAFVWAKQNALLNQNMQMRKIILVVSPWHHQPPYDTHPGISICLPPNIIEEVNTDMQRHLTLPYMHSFKKF